MKQVHIFLLLVTLPLLFGCSRKEYDTSEGLNKEIRLFEKEFSVPIGSIGPFTLSSVFSKITEIPGLGSMLADYIKEGEDGTILLESTGSLFKIDAYDLENQLEDASQPSLWNAGYQSGYVGGLAGSLSLFGIQTREQKLVIEAVNPLRDAVSVTSKATYSCMDSNEAGPMSIGALESFTLPRRNERVELVSMSIPEYITSALSYVNLTDLTLSLPAHPASRIANKEDNLYFCFDYKYSTGIALSSSFHFDLKDLAVRGLNLPLSAFQLKQCDITAEVESTLPIQATINGIRVLKPKASEDEEDTVDEMMEVTCASTINGGSPELPASSLVTIHIEALEGAIPNIGGFQLDVEVAGEPGYGSVALSGKQGIRIKSSSATLSGGITIPREIKQ